MNDTHGARPLGLVLSEWIPPQEPGPKHIIGSRVRLERLDPLRHARAIYDAVEERNSVWDYMSVGPFPQLAAFSAWMEDAVAGDAVFYAFVDPASGRAFGYASFMRIDASNGVVEIGNVVIAPVAQRSRAASGALMAMVDWAFGAGYRRVEWKCNALNAPSRRAARRYGFAFEGIFRNHMIIKGHNRDTAWFAITDADWPDLKGAYDTWLSDDNFDSAGQQIASLSDLTAPIVTRAESALSAL